MRAGKRTEKAQATLRDVAQHAGVSPMTVSRVLNDFPKVKARTREKVLSSISSLNYSPNLAARNLVGGRSRRICLLYANPSSAYLEKVMLGALSAVERYGYQLIIRQVAQDISPEQLKSDLNGAWDGLIIPPPISDIDGVRKMLETEDFPTVFLGSSSAKRKAYELGVDEFQASVDMTEHLISLGHRRIGFVWGHPSHSSSLLRGNGYKEALRNAGIAFDKALTVQGFFDYRSGMDAGHQLLSSANPPTAVFASNDDMAAGVLGAASSRGIKVPIDLSVVGFDDSPIATTIWPNLTTVGQPLVDMAGRAVDILSSVIDGAADDIPTKSVIFLAHTLVVRESASAM